MSSFKDLRIVDNFYQTSAFFPMPTVLISTLTADGKTSLGSYSLIQPYYVAIIDGVKASEFPSVPVDYGYRDSKSFWYTRFKRPRFELLPAREASLSSVKYAADRADATVKFTDEACMKMIKIPRIFLTTALRGCVKWAKENDVTLITEQHMDIINDKRGNEKLK